MGTNLDTAENYFQAHGVKVDWPKFFTLVAGLVLIRKEPTDQTTGLQWQVLATSTFRGPSVCLYLHGYFLKARAGWKCGQRIALNTWKENKGCTEMILGYTESLHSSENLKYSLPHVVISRSKSVTAAFRRKHTLSSDVADGVSKPWGQNSDSQGPKVRKSTVKPSSTPNWRAHVCLGRRPMRKGCGRRVMGNWKS